MELLAQVINRKKCSRCKETKPLESFHKNKTTKNGISHYCKVCRCRLQNEYRREHQDRVKLSYTLWRKKNKARHAELSRNRTKRIKEEVLTAYGGKCACCSESCYSFLTIDHINGNGRQHRGELGGGLNFYVWLKRNGFPKDNYQILCMNCNWGKRLHGSCPHNSSVVRRTGVGG